MTTIHWRHGWRRNATACGRQDKSTSPNIMEVTCGACYHSAEYRRASMCFIPRNHPVWRT